MGLQLTLKMSQILFSTPFGNARPGIDALHLKEQMLTGDKLHPFQYVCFTLT